MTDRPMPQPAADRRLLRYRAADRRSITRWVSSPASQKRSFTMLKQLPATVLTYTKQLRRDDRGAAMVEYALLLAFVSIAAIGVLIALGPEITALFQQVVNAIP
jgi:Flp pilus assembly pilin Flp